LLENKIARPRGVVKKKQGCLRRLIFRQKVPASGWSLLVPAMELDCGCGGGANIKTEKSKAA